MSLGKGRVDPCWLYQGKSLFNRANSKIDSHYLRGTRCITSHEDYPCLICDNDPRCLKCTNDHKSCPRDKGKSLTKKTSKDQYWSFHQETCPKWVLPFYCLLPFTDTLLLVNVNDILVKGEGIISAAECSLVHHRQYFSHSTDSLIQSHNKIVGWLNISSHELSCIIKECRTQLLELSKINRRLKSLQHDLSAHSKVVGDDNHGKGRSRQVVEGGSDCDNNGKEEIYVEASNDGTGFIDHFTPWSFVVSGLKNGLLVYKCIRIVIFINRGFSCQMKSKKLNEIWE